jgi:hypothetical protein
MAQYRFVGASGQVGTKIDWPIELQALVCKLALKDGVKGSQVFTMAVEQFNATAEKPISALPKSYLNKNTASVLYGMKKRFLDKVNNVEHKEHARALVLAQQHGLVETNV